MRYLAVLLLAGCTTVRAPAGSETYFSIQHGATQFGEASQKAQAHCAKLGMKARHLGSDRVGWIVSRFECVR
jgi:hypothetical protein